jgi:hypothetical protein
MKEINLNKGDKQIIKTKTKITNKNEIWLSYGRVSTIQQVKD